MYTISLLSKLLLLMVPIKFPLQIISLILKIKIAWEILELLNTCFFCSGRGNEYDFDYAIEWTKRSIDKIDSTTEWKIIVVLILGTINCIYVPIITHSLYISLSTFLKHSSFFVPVYSFLSLSNTQTHKPTNKHTLILTCHSFIDGSIYSMNSKICNFLVDQSFFERFTQVNVHAVKYFERVDNFNETWYFNKLIKQK